jgi:hypothetical protein
MTPIGHLAVGFAARRAGVKIPLGIILAAAWLLDVLYFVFGFLGLESLENINQPGTIPSPYSHGLLMALVWSTLAGLLAWRVYHNRQAGALIGLVVFSHWVLDFFTWDNTFLLFAGSPQVGVGLFKALGDRFIFLELALFAVGILIYLFGRSRRVSRQVVQS